jgi:CheY-like chemotaxis protein
LLERQVAQLHGGDLRGDHVLRLRLGAIPISDATTAPAARQRVDLLRARQCNMATAAAGSVGGRLSVTRNAWLRPTQGAGSFPDATAAGRPGTVCDHAFRLPEGNGLDTALVIVDDEADIVETLQLLLEMDGYTVFSAVTAEAALALVEEHRPVGVILDLGMPVIDGLELARRLRERHGPDLPLVAVTGWSDERKLDEAELAGVDFVLVKPIDAEALRKIFPPSTP